MEQNILYPKDFINVSILGNISKLIPEVNKPGLPYEAFILMAIAIEFLGASQDDFDWHKEGKSKMRFYAGLKLMGNDYDRLKEILFKKLRCGMAHVYAPVYGLGLSEAKHTELHLFELTDFKENKYLYLQAEKFYADLTKAANEIIEKIDKKGFPKNHKVYKPFLAVPK